MDAAHGALPGESRPGAGRGPLVPVLAWAGGLALIFSAFRAAFYLLYHARIAEVPAHRELFARGLRFDLCTLAIALAPTVFVQLLLPSGRLRFALKLYVSALFLVALFLEFASFGFLDEYDSRPNRLFLENLGKSVEVATTVLRNYSVLLACTVLALAASGWFVWRWSERLIARARPWSWRRRLVALPFVAAVLLFTARGATLGRALNRSQANFTESHLVNELVPNALFTLSCAVADLRLERSPRDLYGDMPVAEVLERVRRRSGLPTEVLRAELPTLHQPPPVAALARPLNLVVVLEESLGAQFVASLGGRPVTPNLEALAREGLWFTRMYATGTRTVRGLEGVICGFPPSPSSSVVKLGLSQTGFFSMAGLLASQGYATDYLYGGKKEFDNMDKFLRSTGFQSTVSQDDFQDPEFVATWGVSDEDLFRKADEIFAAHGEKPFFALILTTSNHTPFEFPDGKIELYDPEKATRNNSVKYADFALGELFRQARTRPYFERTVWVIVADHDTRAPSDELIPLQHFHIPALILGPGVEPRQETRIASQIDLMPSALHLLGLAPAHPMVGRDLLSFDAGDPGRALMQYYNVNGYLFGERLVVHQPFEPARHFRLQGKDLIAVEPDPELERDALAHVLLPWILYEQVQYRLP